MRPEEEDAIVLEVYERQESDRGVALLSARGDLVVAHAPAAARSRRRFGGALQPGARVRARWIRRREGGAPRLEEAALVRMPPSPDPLERYYAAAHLLELARGLAREGAEDKRLFRLLDAALVRLDAPGVETVPLLRYAELWCLRLAGVMPDLERCEVCSRELRGRSRHVASESGAACAEHRAAGALTLSERSARWIDETRHRAPDGLPALGTGAAAELRALTSELLTAFFERPLRALSALERLLAQTAKGDRG